MLGVVPPCRMQSNQPSSNWRKGCLTLLSVRQKTQISWCALFSLISPWISPWKWLQQNNVSVSFYLLIVHAASNRGGKRSCKRRSGSWQIMLLSNHTLFHHLHLPRHSSPHAFSYTGGKKRQMNAPDEALVEQEFPLWSPGGKCCNMFIICNYLRPILKTNDT